MRECKASGKPSTWLPLEELVEQKLITSFYTLEHTIQANNFVKKIRAGQRKTTGAKTQKQQTNARNLAKKQK